MGSTSFRLTIETERETHHRIHHLNLGSSVSANGSFTESDIAGATGVLSEFMSVAKVHNCQRIVAVATESFRLAANGDAVATHIAREAGCEVKVLSPDEENNLVWQAIANQFHAVDNLVAVAITGGSVGIAAGPTNSRVPLHNFSYPLGSSVLAPRASANGFVDTSTRVRLEHHIAESLKPVGAVVRNIATPQFVISGGMPLALTKLIHTVRRSEVPEVLDGLTIDCSDLGHLIKTFDELSLPARLALPGISSKRAPNMALGATILRQVLRSLDVHAAEVSNAGLREGLLGRIYADAKAA